MKGGTAMASTVRARRIAASIAAILTAGLALTGCVTSSASQQVAATGKVVGTFVREGGPIGSGGQQPKVVRLSGVVKFARPGHPAVTIKVGRSGIFALSLAAGKYSVSGRTPSIRVVEPNGKSHGSTCRMPHPVKVTASHTTKITIVCAVP